MMTYRVASKVLLTEKELMELVEEEGKSEKQ